MQFGLADVLRSIVFYIAFVGGTVVLALLSLATPLIGARWSVCLGDRWAHWHRFLARTVIGITVKVEGEVPAGAVLVAGKHESMFEAIDLPVLLHMPVPFAKAELLRIPLWGAVGRRYGLVAVERDQGAKALRVMRNAALQFSSAGRPLVLFPEGTRVPHGERPKLQAGFAGLYKLLNLPVVPFAVDSGPLFRGTWKRGGTITYRFGETIPPGLPRDEAEARVHAAINALNASQNESQ
jgi:1-acyl-sn-glycerol-3-phosphate acyltransferase